MSVDLILIYYDELGLLPFLLRTDWFCLIFTFSLSKCNLLKISLGKTRHTLHGKTHFFQVCKSKLYSRTPAFSESFLKYLVSIYILKYFSAWLLDSTIYGTKPSGCNLTFGSNIQVFIWVSVLKGIFNGMFSNSQTRLFSGIYQNRQCLCFSDAYFFPKKCILLIQHASDVKQVR